MQAAGNEGWAGWACRHESACWLHMLSSGTGWQRRLAGMSGWLDGYTGHTGTTGHTGDTGSSGSPISSPFTASQRRKEEGCRACGKHTASAAAAADT